MDIGRTERERSPARRDDMSSFDRRKTTFTWFHRLERSLCRAGFLQIEEGVFECHRCAVTIYQSEIARENRDSWELHARRQPSCSFVKEIQGQEFIEAARSNEEAGDPMNNNPDVTPSGVTMAEFTRLSECVENLRTRVSGTEHKMEAVEEQMATSVEHADDICDEMTRRTDHLYGDLEHQKSHSSQMFGSLQGSMSSLQSLVDTSIEDMRESLSSTNDRVDGLQTHVFEEVLWLDEAHEALATDVNQLKEDIRPNTVSATIPVPGGMRVPTPLPMLPSGRRVPTLAPRVISETICYINNSFDGLPTEVNEELQSLEEALAVVSQYDQCSDVSSEEQL